MTSKPYLTSVRELYQRAKGRQSSGKIFRPEPGRNLVRLIPPKDGRDLFREIAIHYGLGTGGKQRAFCPVAEKKPCPVCDFLGRNEDTQLGRKLAVKTQYFFNAIVRGQEESGPRIIQVATTVWMATCELLLDEQDPVPLLDPANGYDLMIIRDGEGLQTRHTVRPNTKPSRLADEAKISEWMQQQADLDQVVTQSLMGHEELQALVPDDYGFQNIRDEDIPFN